MVAHVNMKTAKTAQSGPSCLTEENLRLHSFTSSKVCALSSLNNEICTNESLDNNNKI